ncbi:MAG: hypothetical protein HY220_00770 [Candidatus Sungbacteria bacterium]|uniref:Uncharacterized protein n=1 Tax=Candidatus Sungiibacteriota bacterium TaxID=2750080 RepID=A0A9D6LSH1_9BACT|nr:hypothetical protein [Candidatus Sungbacteria bacterium]
MIATSTIDTSGWKTYRNAKYGFEVETPPGWYEHDGPYNHIRLSASNGDMQIDVAKDICIGQTFDFIYEGSPSNLWEKSLCKNNFQVIASYSSTAERVSKELILNQISRSLNVDPWAQISLADRDKIYLTKLQNLPFPSGVKFTGMSLQTYDHEPRGDLDIPLTKSDRDQVLNNHSCKILISLDTDEPILCKFVYLSHNKAMIYGIGLNLAFESINSFTNQVVVFRDKDYLKLYFDGIIPEYSVSIKQSLDDYLKVHSDAEFPGTEWQGLRDIATKLLVQEISAPSPIVTQGMNLLDDVSLVIIQNKSIFDQ